MPDLVDYLSEGDTTPRISIKKTGSGGLYGEYEFGLSSGSLEGAIRPFGGDQVFLFGYEGMDEMDEVSGSGWAHLQSQDLLVGEFVETYGKFTAQRLPQKRRTH